MNWIFLLVIGLAPFVSCDGDKLLDPCEISDIQCLSHATEQFLEHTCKGISEIDVKPIDPLVFSKPLTHVVDSNLGLVFVFENLNMTGLRHQKISSFHMDIKAKSVVLKTTAELNIVSQIRIELNGKEFTGTYQATAKVLGTASYNYELIKDNEGVEHFTVGPETLTCEIIEEPTVSISDDLENALANDPVARSRKEEYVANNSNYRKQTLGKIAEEAYKVVVHNIRASAKALPKEAFFKGI